MRRALLIILFAVAQATGSTQTPSDRDDVLEVVQAFFDTMMVRNVEGARKVLVPEGHFFAVDMRTPTKAGAQLLRNEEYFKALQQGKSIRREWMWSPEVRVHGAIATVWRLSLPNTWFLLEPLLLQPTMSNLLSDVRLHRPLPDGSRLSPLARGFAARGSRLTAPASHT